MKEFDDTYYNSWKVCCGDVVSVSCFRTAVSGARPRDFVVLPACRSLHNSAGFQCVITRRKPHVD
ncbi:hypothetical protein NQZ68_003158 [Dissostichus eleginoides]|nr:hypothetical protein NQZ68_003158 [Dissostichus eleginoides]